MTHHLESPTAERILAIDDEIAALERAMPKARGIINGVAVIVILAFPVCSVPLEVTEIPALPLADEPA